MFGTTLGAPGSSKGGASLDSAGKVIWRERPIASPPLAWGSTLTARQSQWHDPQQAVPHIEDTEWTPRVLIASLFRPAFPGWAARHLAWYIDSIEIDRIESWFDRPEGLKPGVVPWTPSRSSGVMQQQEFLSLILTLQIQTFCTPVG